MRLLQSALAVQLAGALVAACLFNSQDDCHKNPLACPGEAGGAAGTTGMGGDTPCEGAACPKPKGADCASGNECGTGICADGVCCDELCDRPCQACNLDGPQKGSCSPLPA